MKDAAHTPVMLEEMVSALSPSTHALYVDGTFGGGGYSRAILAAADCRVLAFDKDPMAVEAGRAWAGAYGGRLEIDCGAFGAFDEALTERGETELDGVVLDLGVSSMQLDEPDRGFSFQSDGPLDMRMGAEGASAADVVNGAGVKDLSRIISVYGEEKRANAVARAIERARDETAITRTLQLADIVAGAVGGRGASKTHPATKTFQALRIFVNDELGELVRGLMAAERKLHKAGRLVVVSFHSLEDRIVKRFLNERAGRMPSPSRHAPPEPARAKPSFRLLYDKAVEPSEEETGSNPRARSARLRAGVRTDAPIISGDVERLGYMPELQTIKLNA